jgi:hypothetical protein
MAVLWRARGLIAVGLVLGALALVRPAASAGPGRIDAGHGLSVVVPAGARLTHRHFTPCADPAERFSVLDGRAILTIQERLGPEAGPQRQGLFHVEGPARPMECCAIEGRSGWVLHFLDHGRSFYAYLYPAGGSSRTLLHMLDSLRVAGSASA